MGPEKDAGSGQDAAKGEEKEPLVGLRAVSSLALPEKRGSLFDWAKSLYAGGQLASVARAEQYLE